MVAASHYLASTTGLDVLRSGGSAVDAAIATNAVLSVAYPHMAGLGGDGFWLIYDPSSRGLHALNASGPAARAATREAYHQRGHAAGIPERGPAAALTVPGAVDGWAEAHARFGRLPWAELFTDAIGYARSGVSVSRSLAGWLGRSASFLAEQRWAASVFLPGGRTPRQGERLIQTDLARSLERIARQGPRDGFYNGETAERICGALGAGGSPLRTEDFANFRSEWTEPISTTYRDATVYEFPPNSQGFAALQILNLIEPYDLHRWEDLSADYLHHLVEATKLAFADRDAWLTDPRFVEIPTARFVAKEYAAERRAMIDAHRATPIGEVSPGIAYAGPVPRPAGGDTCYFCAIDDRGLVVSVIQSIYHAFGSGVVGGATGIVLQNRGSSFSLDANAANRLEPGKRPFHTLMPAMLFEAGEPSVAFGTMGGNGQAQTHAGLVTRLVDFGYDVQQAIEAPRWVIGHTLGEAEQLLWLEGRIPAVVAEDLKRRGQPVQLLGDWDESMGHAQAIRICRQSGFLEGGADPRGDGVALGY
jgi:gamma-glutamyltranspeptidase